MRIIDAIFDALVVARWIHFAATFLLFGCSFAFVYMGLSSSMEGPGSPAAIAGAQRIIRIAAVFAFASGIGWLFATMASMGGGFASALDPDFLHVFFFETPFGTIAMARLVLLAALLVPAILPMRSTVRAAATGVVSTLLLVSQAWLGHAAEGGNTIYGAAMIASYAAHVLAGAAWVGGLPILILAIAERRRWDQSADQRSAILDLLFRFSSMAFVAVSVILISGTANAAFRVGGDFGALVSTRYGTVLLGKLVLVAVMLGLAGYNRFLAMPRLQRSHQGDTARRAGHLRQSIMLELALGVFVLGAAAVLGITPPPH